MFSPVTFLKSKISKPFNIVPVHLLDQFTDANGTLLTAHVIAPYNVPATSWVAGVGTFQIQANAATPNSNVDDDKVWCDPGLADCTITCDIVPFDSGLAIQSIPAILLRLTDSTHYWMVHAPSYDDLIVIFENAGAGLVSRASGAVTLNSGTSYALKIVASGTNITAYVNNVQICAYGSATSNQTATKVGFRLGKQGVIGPTTWDNLIVAP